jgi:hypothetical protein
VTRFIGYLALLVIALLLLPAWVRAAQAVIPFLLSIIVALAIASLLWPSGRRRR